MLESERIRLRDIETEDLPLIARWRSKPEVLEGLFSFLPLSKSRQEKWYENYLKDEKTQFFVIELKETRQPIGTVGLTNIDYRNQKAELSTILGEIKFWGKGFGKEATELLLDFGFSEMNLNRVYLRVMETNKRAIRLYEKVGFQREGLLREDYFSKSTFVNVVVMSILCRDWKGRP